MQHQQLADDLHRLRAGVACQAGHQLAAGIAVVAEHSHFDQTVCNERALDFGKHRRGQASVADHHDRVQVVGARAQFLALGS